MKAPTGVPLKLAVLAGVLDTGANVAMLLALQASLLSLSGVLMSLYPVATVLLAIVVLRERVTPWQAVGMAMAVGAVAMIAARLADLPREEAVPRPRPAEQRGGGRR
ncbi:hypothetical protein MDOR_10920 [Mycolicibacterium doricum]|uniref:EamA domain-containing protein n=1 Tax=Mycolicibacterium doricum TaxID=126673 RepID=A0A7I7VRY2_9MYCO|nr:hypothetical protein MDOR_10920 [Mycolicibacterium doricum]